jgi:hypothetical protein
VCCNPVCPLVEAEACGCIVDLLVSSPGRALGSVIELGEDPVERRLRDSIGEASVGHLTLRSCGDKQTGLDGLQLVDKVAIVGGEANCSHSTRIGLEVKVEAINVHITEGSGLAGVNPFLGGFSESSHKELGEPQSNTLVGKGVISRCGSTTERQQDLLAVIPADLNAWSDGWASLQQRRVVTSLWVREDVTPACIACEASVNGGAIEYANGHTKVGLWVVANILGKLSDEGEVDDLD